MSPAKLDYRDVADQSHGSLLELSIRPKKHYTGGCDNILAAHRDPQTRSEKLPITFIESDLHDPVDFRCARRVLQGITKASCRLHDFPVCVSLQVPMPPYCGNH